MGDLLRYFSEDPLRALYLLGGSGGAVYWWDRFWSRPHLEVRFVDETFDLAGGGDLKVETRFEVQNLGTSPASLDHVVPFSGYTVQGKRLQANYQISEPDRTLPPSTPKIFTLTATIHNYPFLWYRTYRFGLSRGRGKKVRIRSADKEEIGPFKFLCELPAFIHQSRRKKG